MSPAIRLVTAAFLVTLARAAQPLPRSTPEAQGVSSEALRKFVETADHQVDTMHSFMLVRHGHVVAEGWWGPESADKPHVLYSLSKSFTSTAVGLAIAEGKLTLDDPVLKFFPNDAPAQPQGKLKSMRVRDLLSMSTGHQTEPRFTADEPWVRTFLNHPVEHKPGSHFQYNSPATYTCSAIVQSLTGQTVLDYLKPRLFEPLGIEGTTWTTSPQGICAGGWGLYLKTEDIAKFGQLYLQKGQWNGRQIIPAEWVAQATSRQVSNGSNPASDWDLGYGFQFWRCRHGAFRGDGAFGQFCIVLPEQDAVVAITADTKDMQGELNIVWDQLLPAFRPAPLPANDAAAAALKQTLGSLRVRPEHVTNVIPLPPEVTPPPVMPSLVLQPFVERRQLAGAVALVADKTHTLAVEGAGFSDIEHGKPMREDTLFWIASQTKPMTAAAVMMLVDEGRIALDDPVEKYLPEFRGQQMIAERDDARTVLRKPSRPITLRDVLSHMSGLPFKSAAEEPTLDALPLAAAVRSYAMTPLQWEPGTRYHYSNAGINTAARVLEVVSGMAYEDFLQRRLLDPLGMKDTTFWPTPQQVLRLAKSYGSQSGIRLQKTSIPQLHPNLSDRTRRYAMPAGGLFSTAADTARFCRMLLNGGEFEGKRLLSENAVREMSRRQTPATVNDSYGLGLNVSPDSFGHGGAQSTNMEIRPADGLVLVWMVQHTGFPGDGGKAQGVWKEGALRGFAGK